MKRWLGERRPVLGFDTETEGLFWWRENLRLVQFGDAKTGWSIPFDDWKGLVKECLRDYEGPIVGHNVRFDQRYLAQYTGITLGTDQVHDTMLLAHLLAPNERLGLKNLAARLIDPNAVAGEAMLQEAMNKNKWTWKTVPIELPAYWAYGALDAILSAQLWELMIPQVRELGMESMYDLERATSSVLFGMEMTGARIDVEYCETKYERLIAYHEQMQHWCQSEYGVHPGSNKDVTGRLTRDGVELTSRTPGGALRLDMEVLEALEHPLAAAVLNTRKAQKIANTYFKNFLELRDGDVLHMMIRQVGARTGRMSITEPALQTLPRGDVVRNAFIPRDDHKLLSIDFEQVEMRLFAHFANEEQMIERIRAGYSLHTIVAQEVYDLGDAEPSRAQYQVTKSANFCRVFGGGSRKFAQTAGISEAEGKAFYEKYEIMFPGATKFQHDLEEVMRGRLKEEGKAWVRTPFGRRLVVDNDRLYAGVNFLIQATAADVFKRALVNLDLVELGPTLRLPVHDEVIMEVPTDEAFEMRARAIPAMEDRTNFKVPLAVDASQPMDRWSK